MRSHPRIRKSIKWGGAAVTVLLVVVWIGSCFRGRSVVFWKMGVQIDISGGQIAFDYSPHENDFGMDRSTSPEYLTHRWWIPPSSDMAEGGLQWCVFIPLWALAGMSLIATTAAWRLDTIARRRARLNLCPKCKYDRAGLAAEAKCPECGSVGGAA